MAITVMAAMAMVMVMAMAAIMKKKLLQNLRLKKCWAGLIPGNYLAKDKIVTVY